MLEDAKIMATIAVSDLARSAEFYESKLGLKPSEMGRKDGEQVMLGADGSMLSLHEPLQRASEHTAAAFMVEGDISTRVAQLREAGIKFEEYDMPGLKTENGIATSPSGKCAWFKDPDGNLLAVFSRQ